MDIESITNKIINADCMDILKQLPDKCIDAIICDLPYGTTNCSWDSIIPFEKLWEQYKRIRKDNTPIVLFGSEPFSSLLRCSNLKEFKYDWIWNKISGGNVLTTKYQPLKTHENISVFCKEKISYLSVDSACNQHLRCALRSGRGIPCGWRLRGSASQYGNDAYIAPQASLTDGLMDGNTESIRKIMRQKKNTKKH